MISPTFGEGYTFYEPIKLHPQNSHYLWFRGEPTLLITSAEHYGAVLNKGFDFETYLQTLHNDGMNYTRIFTGSYIERPGAFGIQYNTLAPTVENLIVPWKRTDIPGYIGGGNRFDLDQWDTEYFDRLHQFVQRANELWIAVEVTLFTSHFGMWEYSPLHHANNVNELPELPVHNALTKHNGDLLHHQEKMVRKLINELNGYDNVFYEVQNEPYVEHGVSYSSSREESVTTSVDQSSHEWQELIASYIVDEELSLQNSHLIAQNVAKDYIKLSEVPANISIINMHYARPEVVADNYELGRPISLDETGYLGANPESYRKQAWAFMLSGGAVYNNLDYSFYPGKEDGTGENAAPGSGGPQLRKYLKILKDFMMKLDFIQFKPMSWNHQDQQVYVLAHTPKTYAGYVLQSVENQLYIELPNGSYRIQWYDTETGELLEMTNFETPIDRVSISNVNSIDDKAFVIKKL